MAIVITAFHNHNQWSCMKKNQARTNQCVISVKKVYMITTNEDAWGNSCKLKTYSYSTCNKNFAHSQSVIMHEKKSCKGKQICCDF